MEDVEMGLPTPTSYMVAEPPYRPTPFPTRRAVPPTPRPRPTKVCPSVEELGGVYLDVVNTTDRTVDNLVAVAWDHIVRLVGYTVIQENCVRIFAVNTDCNSEQIKGTTEITTLQSGPDCLYNTTIEIPSELVRNMLYGDKLYIFAGPCNWGAPQFKDVTACKDWLDTRDLGGLWGCEPVRVCSPEFFNDEASCYHQPCSSPDNIIMPDVVP